MLIWRVLGYDSDGIELFFTDPATKFFVGPSKKQTVETFLGAMRDARPTSESPPTELRRRLKSIMSTYELENRKPRTVFILTDGKWEGMPYESYIEDWVTHNLCELGQQDPKTLQSPSRESGGESNASAWQSNFEESRPITFQFIAFGHSTIGKRRMKRLDDLMAQENGLP